MKSRFLIIVLALFTVLPNASFSKEVKVDFGEIEIPDFKLNDLLLLTGILQFKNNWADEHFSEEMSQKIKIILQVDDVLLGEATFSKTEKSSDLRWQLPIKISKFSKEIAKKIRSKKVKIKLVSEEKVLYEN